MADQEPEDQGYPKPSESLTKAMIGVQLHFKKLVGDHQDMLDLVNAKIRAIGEQAEPDVEELAKLKRIRHSLQLELDKLRYSNLEV